MPSQLIYIIEELYQDDKYILIDGDKQASVQPTHGFKQGCPLLPLLFSIYANDMGCITGGDCFGNRRGDRVAKFPCF
eukprot:652984-Pelagomonas_calceolata.AAC.1